MEDVPLRSLLPLILLLPLLTAVAPQASPAAASQPSIVLINTDDMRLGDLVAMPKTRQLIGNQGLSFDRFFATTPQCCPSRATLLRGQYAHNTGVRGNTGATGGYSAYRPLQADSLPVWLSAAGYRTALIGKYLNGYGGPDVPPGWDRWVASTSQNLYDYDLAIDGAMRRHGAKRTDFLVSVVAKKATRFIETTDPDDPLFLYFAPTPPHAPAGIAPRYTGVPVPESTVPRTPAYNEADVSDKPAWLQALPRLTKTQRAAIDREHRKRQRSLMAVDDAVSNIIGALEATGRLDETYVIFISDHGYSLGEHRLPPGKWAPYDETARVPLLVRGPGVPVGATTPLLAGMPDLAPTIADIAGADIPAFVDGRSLLPLWQGKSPAWRSALLIEFFEEGRHKRKNSPKPPVRGYEAIRTADALYVEYSTGDRERYDLTADPWQLESLVGEDPAADAAWSVRLEALQSCSGVACRSAEDVTG